MKLCTKCGVEKPSSDFGKRSNRKSGLQAHCKLCTANYRNKNRARLNEHAREYIKRPDVDTRRSDYKKSYYQENREAILEQKRQHHQRDDVAAQRRSYRERKRESLAEARRRWRMENPSAAASQVARRRAARKRAIPSWADEKKMRPYYAIASFLSAHFGVPWHVDHVVPLQSPLVCGLHTQINLTFMPAAWNQAKHNKHWPDMP